LVEFIRPQHRFGDIEALRRQLAKDVRRAEVVTSALGDAEDPGVIVL
jgi:FAD synthase